MARKSEFVVEVVLYDKADWAPKNSAVGFKWAWRIIATDNTTRLTGFSNDPYEKVRQMAQGAADRMLAYRKGNYKSVPNQDLKNKARRKPKTSVSSKSAPSPEDEIDATPEF